eukprot:2367302-Pyramimonas_sp.AAC.1
MDSTVDGCLGLGRAERFASAVCGASDGDPLRGNGPRGHCPLATRPPRPPQVQDPQKEQAAGGGHLASFVIRVSNTTITSFYGSSCATTARMHSTPQTFVLQHAWQEQYGEFNSRVTRWLNKVLTANSTVS